jgi:DNA-binding MarR family transcriptional regulator
VERDPDELRELVEALGRVLEGELRERAAAEGLQPVHLRALDFLDRANRYSNTPRALADFLGLTKGTVSQSLLLLHRRGLLERSPDPGDGRVVRLGLSGGGRALLARARRGGGAWREALEALPVAAGREAAALLRQLLLGMQARRGRLTFGACRTCRHLRAEGPGGFRCGLTGEALRPPETLRICREHAWPEAAG